MVLGHGLTYFVKYETKDKKFYPESGGTSMLEFHIDSIFVEFGGHILK
jgi:hypothetical protein